MKVPRIMVTREHGSWAVVFVPLIVAAGVVGRYAFSEFLLFCAAISGFMLYVPLQTILRRRITERPSDERYREARFWVAVFGTISLACGSALLFMGFHLVVVFGLAAAAFFFANLLLVRYFQKTPVSDLVAVAGLTLGAPAMYYAATGRIGEKAFSFWLLNLLFFGSSVFYVHMKMRASSLKKADLTFVEKLSVGRLNILYHLLVLLIVAAFALTRFAPGLAILAFVPIIVHAVAGTMRLSSQVRYKTLGYALLVQSLFFCLLIVLVERH